MRDWPGENEVVKSLNQLLGIHGSLVSAHYVMMAEMVSDTHALFVDSLAVAIVDGAHDIANPRLRNGPWRPGWRPFG